MEAGWRNLVLVALWVAWWLPFARQLSGEHPRAQQKDRRARWGILLQAAGFFLAFAHTPQVWKAPHPLWRVAVGVLCGLTAAGYSWSSVGRLGRQWRFDAGLNADHELITTGAYRIVRHPIYASMFWLFAMGIAMIGTLPGWPVAVALFITGIEIRVHIEDALLLERFGERFLEWKRRTPAWMPGVR